MKANSKANLKADRPARSRYSELKDMLEERRREIQAEVQGKMRDVRAEGTCGGKQNEVFDAVESSEALQPVHDEQKNDPKKKRQQHKPEQQEASDGPEEHLDLTA